MRIKGNKGFTGGGLIGTLAFTLGSLVITIGSLKHSTQSINIAKVKSTNFSEKVLTQTITNILSQNCWENLQPSKLPVTKIKSNGVEINMDKPFNEGNIHIVDMALTGTEDHRKFYVYYSKPLLAGEQKTRKGKECKASGDKKGCYYITCNITYNINSCTTENCNVFDTTKPPIYCPQNTMYLTSTNSCTPIPTSFFQTVNLDMSPQHVHTLSGFLKDDNEEIIPDNIILTKACNIPGQYPVRQEDGTVECQILCTGGSTYNTENKQCECKDRNKPVFIKGKCQAVCPVNQEKIENQCVCLAGYNKNADGNCISCDTSRTGLRFDPISKRCKCPPNKYNSRGICCKSGWRNSNGICCNINDYNSNGICCSWDPRRYNSNGICCWQSWHNSQGLCCRDGYHNSNGKCCKNGWHNSQGLCCPTGESAIRSQHGSLGCCPLGGRRSSSGHCCPPENLLSNGYCCTYRSDNTRGPQASRCPPGIAPKWWMRDRKAYCEIHYTPTDGWTCLDGPCPYGHHQSNGICCRNGYHNSNRKCCRNGYHNSNGKCCSHGRYNSNGICCPNNYHNSNGRCCPKGKHYANGICCRDGYHNSQGLCCQNGWHNSNGKCCPINTHYQRSVNKCCPDGEYGVRSQRGFRGCCPSGAVLGNSGHCCPPENLLSTGYCCTYTNTNNNQDANCAAYFDRRLCPQGVTPKRWIRSRKAYCEVTAECSQQGNSYIYNTNIRCD